MGSTETHLTTNGHVNGTEEGARLTILHLGDPIEYNHTLYSHLKFQFNIIRPDPSCLSRRAFKRHLQAKTWGNFSAIMRPYWNTGNEMARWDRELIELLPHSMKVMASAGAGYEWVDVDVLAEYGTCHPSRALGEWGELGNWKEIMCAVPPLDKRAVNDLQSRIIANACRMCRNTILQRRWRLYRIRC